MNETAVICYYTVTGFSRIKWKFMIKDIKLGIAI